MAYYEVFNEQLETLSANRAQRVAPGDWRSRHPNTDPYFLEFVPLIRLFRGVSGYDRTMAFRRFIPRKGPDSDISRKERTYVTRLVSHAERSGRYPVLTSTRSLGRVAGLRRAFPGLHVVLYRNLFDQWLSYVEQNSQENAYFLCSVQWAVEGSRHDQLCRRLIRRGGLGRPEADNRALFAAFVAIHAYVYAHAVNAADLVIDSHCLADQPQYRDRIERVISDAAGFTVDLSGARNVRSVPSVLPFGAGDMMPEIRSLLTDALKPLIGTPGHAFSMTALNQLEEDLDRAGQLSRFSYRVATPSYGTCQTQDL